MSETNQTEGTLPPVVVPDFEQEPETMQPLGMVSEAQVTYANLPIVMSQADRTWQHYGHILAPIAFRNRWDKLDTRSGYYLWLQNQGDYVGTDEQLLERKLLKDTQTFLPHEEVSHQLTEIFDNELKGSGLHITDRHQSHHGDTMHWTILSDSLNRNIENSYVGKDDIVRFGAVVRNGIGTNVALGVDLFTYRLICENGAIARGTDLGSFSISHARRKDERIQDAIVPAIKRCVEHLKDFTDYYQQATKIAFNQKILDTIITKLAPSDRMIPEKDIDIDYDLRRKKEKNPTNKDLQHQSEYKISRQGKEKDMWHIFNDFTELYWHNNKMSFHRISRKEQQLHQVLIQTVERRI
jgi:hypothetical protein